MRIDDLNGKAALVTGSSTGIGAAVARGFGAQGMMVAVHGNSNMAQAEAVAAEVEQAGGRAIVLKGDVRDMATCARLVQEAHAAFGRLDVLVNNAGGVVERKPLKDVDDDLYRRIVELNAQSVFACSRAVLPIMEAAGGGSIISTTSLAARNGGGSRSTLYAASKAFMSTFTRGLAKEVARHNIRVNAVAPGVIGKPNKEKSTPTHQLEASLKLTPMRRMGTVEECVGAYLYFASEGLSSFVTGQVLEVNGGLLMP
ncbi:3-oxoacyl-[acyl-carrier protein] reductase [Stella humosa]|uniref:3-oxoacyl-[acyl-carrier protein] reductase n=1 Tax=Stella humosa TaxID=94 RepID=A0A3N1M7V1_9PROT|nr:SDR family oxidoreductase [Stella humosa]ROP99802.1 3-oxoacyl-[acyl-carrier protein] reductase [Stella humosa]BBK30970.1 oxidoreductase [Stella humosa]